MQNLDEYFILHHFPPMISLSLSIWKSESEIPAQNRLMIKILLIYTELKERSLAMASRIKLREILRSGTIAQLKNTIKDCSKAKDNKNALRAAIEYFEDEIFDLEGEKTALEQDLNSADPDAERERIIQERIDRIDRRIISSKQAIDKSHSGISYIEQLCAPKFASFDNIDLKTPTSIRGPKVPDNLLIALLSGVRNANPQKNPKLRLAALERAVDLLREGDTERGLMSFEDVLSTSGALSNDDVSRNFDELNFVARVPEAARRVGRQIAERLPEAALDLNLRQIGVSDPEALADGKAAFRANFSRGMGTRPSIAMGVAAAAGQAAAKELVKRFRLKDVSDIDRMPGRNRAEAEGVLRQTISQAVSDIGTNLIDQDTKRIIRDATRRALSGPL